MNEGKEKDSKRRGRNRRAATTHKDDREMRREAQGRRERREKQREGGGKGKNGGWMKGQNWGTVMATVMKGQKCAKTFQTPIMQT